MLWPLLERQCPGNPCPGSLYPLLFPAIHPSSTSSTHHPGPRQDSERARAHSTTARGADRNPRRGLRERSVLRSDSAAFPLAHRVRTAGLLQSSRFLPHFCSQSSAAENCRFQEGQALPSAQGWRALLAQRGKSSPSKQRAAGGEVTHHSTQARQKAEAPRSAPRHVNL